MVGWVRDATFMEDAQINAPFPGTCSGVQPTFLFPGGVCANSLPLTEPVCSCYVERCISSVLALTLAHTSRSFICLHSKNYKL